MEAAACAAMDDMWRGNGDEASKTAAWNMSADFDESHAYPASVHVADIAESEITKITGCFATAENDSRNRTNE